MFLEDGLIKSISYEPSDKILKELSDQNKDGKEIDCQNKIIIPDRSN